MNLRNPFRYCFHNATLILVAVNAVVYFITLAFPHLKVYLGVSYYGVKFHYYWQFITYMFTHGNMMHVFFNMIALLCFGIQFERAVGTREFLLYYFLCGILGGIISMIVYSFFGVNVFLMGASGVVYALLLAYAVVFPRNMIFIWGIVPVPAPLLVLIYAGISFFSQFSQGSGIAHVTHLFGLVIGWIYFMVRMGINPWQVWKNAWRR